MEKQFIALDPAGDPAGDNFQPGQLWHFGIDIYVHPVEIYWVSPDESEHTLLGTRDSVGLWQMTSPPEGIFYFSTEFAGSRVWVMT